MRQPDPDEFDAILGSNRFSRKRTCKIGEYIQSLGQTPFRDRLVQHMNSDIEHFAIRSAVLESTGIDLERSAFSRHRRLQCNCPGELYL